MTEVYISGSLLHSDREWWNIYEKIGEVVQQFGLIPYIPHIHTPATVNSNIENIIGSKDDSHPVHESVFLQDKKTVENCKLVIAEVTNPSTGSGIELGWAISNRKPIICLAKKGAKVTSLIKGPANSGLVYLIRYENEKDALDQLKILLEKKFRDLISK